MANENMNQTTNSTSELAVRREKLQALYESGNNPFEITKYNVTHKSAAAVALFEEKEATLAEGETMREESVSTEEILTAKEWVESALGQPYQCNIIYHLEENELKNYNDNEISKIYSRN